MGAPFHEIVGLNMEKEVGLVHSPQRRAGRFGTGTGQQRGLPMGIEGARGGWVVRYQPATTSAACPGNLGQQTQSLQRNFRLKVVKIVVISARPR
jgi:hypothetical protein